MRSRKLTTLLLGGLLLQGAITGASILDSGCSSPIQETREEKTDTMQPLSEQEGRSLIERISKEEPSPYLEGVHLDYNKNLVIETQSKKYDELFRNPKYKEALDDLFIKHARQRGLPRGFARGIVNSPLARPNLERTIKKIYLDKLREQAAETPMIMPFIHLYFGAGKKSEAFFFKSSLEPETHDFNGQTFNVSPETKIRVYYRIGAGHAKYISAGVALGDALEINKDNYGKIDARASNFVVAAASRMDAFESFINSGKISPELRYSAGLLVSFMNKSQNFLRYGTLNDYDNKLVKAAVDRYVKLLPGITQIFSKL